MKRKTKRPSRGGIGLSPDDLALIDQLKTLVEPTEGKVTMVALIRRGLRCLYRELTVKEASR